MPWPFKRKTAPAISGDVVEDSRSPSMRFAFRLFRRLALASDSPNVFFSPASVRLCLAMVHELASGDTRDRMAFALELTGLHAAEVENEIALLKSAFLARPEVALASANSMWLALDSTIDADCTARLLKLYQSELLALDFAASDAVSVLNSWVEGKTKGKILRLIDRISPRTALVALNAVYFKGVWERPFTRTFTRDGEFSLDATRKKTVPMMVQSGTYNYWEDRQSQMAVLPYKGGVSMLIVLPAEGTNSAEFLAEMNSGEWDARCARLKPMEGTIQMPRFKLDDHREVGPALAALGMSRAFDPQHAEFFHVHTKQPPVWIERVVHRAVADVNEEGTEAAAATAVITRALSARQKPRPHFNMIVNRPFVVAISDDTTKIILFLGWVAAPE